MAPSLGEISLDQQQQQYSAPSTTTDSYEQYYDSPYSTFVPTSSDPVSYFYTSGNLYMYQDVDGIYRWADASAARSDSCTESSFPLYRPSDPIPLSAYCAFQHADFEEPSQATTIHHNSYIFHLAQQFTNGSSRNHVQDHRSSIARASDNFLAQASSIFSDGHSSSRRGSTTLDYRSSLPHHASPQRDARTPSRKRSRESFDEGSYLVKEKDDNAHPSLPAANDACRLPQPHMTGLSSARIPHLGDAPTLNADSRARETDLRLRPEERRVLSVPKHTNNKRVHRASEDIVRQENAILSMPATWSIPEDPVMKGTKKPGEQKKQALACLFCRERKIACGRPPAHSPDQTCNQCARRRIKCEYPTESRRGQHKRRRKLVESEHASQSAVRTTSTTAVAPTTTASSSTILMTTPASA